MGRASANILRTQFLMLLRMQTLTLSDKNNFFIWTFLLSSNTLILQTVTCICSFFAHATLLKTGLLFQCILNIISTANSADAWWLSFADVEWTQNSRICTSLMWCRQGWQWQCRCLYRGYDDQDIKSSWLIAGHHHHHHRQPWAQCPLMSDAIVTIAAHHCLSRAAWLNSCRVAPHHCSMSSDHFRWGRPFLFEPSIIPNTRVFIFLLSFILQIWLKRRNFLCITFCSRVSANWIFLYNSSLVTFCVHPILRIFR